MRQDWHSLYIFLFSETHFVQVIESAKGFIMLLVEKMLKSVPLKFLKTLKVISPSAIDELKVDGRKKWAMNY